LAYPCAASHGRLWACHRLDSQRNLFQLAYGIGVIPSSEQIAVLTVEL
jgi:hypothetical protein